MGFIGLGNIGTMLIGRLVSFINPDAIFAYDINSKKTTDLKNKLKINVSKNIQDLVRQCDVVFLCIKLQNLNEVLKKIVNPKGKIFITTVAAITQSTYYKKLGQVELIRIIPSMINKVGGPILFMRGNYASNNSVQRIKEILEKIGNIFEVKESDIDAYTHLTSCSPAIIVEFLRLYILSLVKEKKIDKDVAIRLISDVLKITTQLFAEEGFKIIPRVCTKGGITEVAVKKMQEYEETFFKDITSTLLKRMEEVRKNYEQ